MSKKIAVQTVHGLNIEWVFCDDESGIGRDEQYFETRQTNAKAELQGWVYAYRAR